MILPFSERLPNFTNSFIYIEKSDPLFLGELNLSPPFYKGGKFPVSMAEKTAGSNYLLWNENNMSKN